MKIARYEYRSASIKETPFQVVMTLDEEEYLQLGQPSEVEVKVTETGLSMRPARLGSGRASGRIVISQREGQERVVRANFYAPLFPGTKVFGAETVESIHVDRELHCELPRMVTPVKKAGGDRRSERRRRPLPDADIGALVRELNERRRADRGLRFEVDAEGSLRVLREWT